MSTITVEDIFPSLNAWVILASGDENIHGIALISGRTMTVEEKWLNSKALQHRAFDGLFRVITKGKCHIMTYNSQEAIDCFNNIKFDVDS